MIHGPNPSIYIVKPIGAEGPFKIGVSSMPSERLKALMVWSPTPLEIVASFPGTMKLEQNLHACLGRSLSHCEWFFATDEVKDFVAKIVAGMPVEQAIDLSKKYDHRVSVREKRSKAWTPEHRRYMGNFHRVRFAELRASKAVGARVVAPLSVQNAVDAQSPASWGKYGTQPRRIPDYSGQPAIDQFVSDPLKYGELFANGKRRPLRQAGSVR